MDSSTPPVPSLMKLGLALLLAVLLGHVGIFLVGGLAGVTLPRAIEYGEPFIVSAAFAAGTGGTLYAPVDDLPYRHNNYNPGVQLLVAPLLAGSGLSYVPMRLLTMLAVLGIGCQLLIMTRRRSGSWVAGAVCAGLILTCGFMFPWMCVGRVDAVAAFFSTAAAIYGLKHAPSDRRFLGVLILGWLAFIAKQSVVGGVGAVLLHSFLCGHRQRAFVMGLAFTAGCAAIAATANWVSDGQYWLHAVAYNASHDRGPLWPQTLPPVLFFGAIGWPLLILLVASLFSFKWKVEGAWLCWFLVSGVLAFVLVRKSGAHMHYFLEPIAALSVFGTLTLSRWWRERPDLAGKRGVALGALAAVIALATLPGVPWQPREQWRTGLYWKWQQARGFAAAHDRNEQVPAEVASRIKDGLTPPLLLAQTASFAVECGREAIFDIADFVRLGELGKWNAKDRLLDQVQLKVFPVIAVQLNPKDTKHFSVDSIPGLKESIEAAYRPLGEDFFFDKGRRSARFFVPKD